MGCLNKKGQEALGDNLIFLFLVVFFYVIMLIFAKANVTGYAVYEQTYAKQISLLIDEAKPGMTFIVNMGDAMHFVEKNNKPLTDVVFIDSSSSKVVVRLGERGGYYMPYLSNYKITYQPLNSAGLFVFKVEEKDG